MEENEIITTEVSNVPVVSTTEEALTNTDPLKMMQDIADYNFTESVQALTNSNAVKNQMKLFLISECKRELYKVVQYSKMLDVIEKRFQERFIDNINDVPDAQLPQLMNLMMGCIDRSNNLINSILKDEEVLNLLVIQNNNFNKNEIVSSSELLNKLYNSIPETLNPSAVRMKIVEAVTNIVNNLETNNGGGQ